jgi:hypothetical protein
MEAVNSSRYYHPSDWSGGPWFVEEPLGSSKVVLWADANRYGGRLARTSEACHNLAAPNMTGTEPGFTVNRVTGFNEVMADGHVQWFKPHDLNTMIFDDVQAETLVVTKNRSWMVQQWPTE